jgi:hypothetical protein
MLCYIVASINTIYIYIYIDNNTGFGYQTLFTLVRKSETEKLLWDTDLEIAKEH